MKEPATIKGYLALIRKIEKMMFSDKKGFDDLPENVQEAIGILSADISNALNEVEALLANPNQPG